MSIEDNNFWEDHKKERQEKKARNEEYSIKMLDDLGIKYKILNKFCRHYRVYDFDYWPSTGKFYNQRTGEIGRGIKNLIKRIK